MCQFSGCGAAFVLASGLNLHLKEEHPFRCGGGVVVKEKSLFAERYSS